MNFEIRPMLASDYDLVIGLWQGTEGVGLSKADSPEAVTRYLERNPGLSMTAWCDPGRLAGAVLCGHDGRRGFLHHLAVHPGCRRMGLGRQLVARCIQGLRIEGIDKCHLFVFNKNENGREFWTNCGWVERSELVIMSTDC